MTTANLVEGTASLSPSTCNLLLGARKLRGGGGWQGRVLLGGGLGLQSSGRVLLMGGKRSTVICGEKGAGVASGHTLQIPLLLHPPPPPPQASPSRLPLKSWVVLRGGGRNGVVLLRLGREGGGGVLQSSVGRMRGSRRRRRSSETAR